MLVFIYILYIFHIYFTMRTGERRGQTEQETIQWQCTVDFHS